MTFARVLFTSLIVPLIAATYAAAASDPVPLSSCGVVGSGTYYLESDLDCSGAPGGAIEFIDRGRIELRGFTITGDSAQSAVRCQKRCDVVGPGVLDGAGVELAAVATIDGITIRNAYVAVDAENVDSGRGTARITNSIFVDNEFGVLVSRYARLIDSSVTGSQRDGVWANGYVRKGPSGPCRGRIVLENSDISGNGLAGDVCGSHDRPCVDVASCKPPVLDALSSCERSFRFGSIEESWGVCTLD
ncbi:MAG TPA: hypothetical protein VEL28_09315 [Candidatus Binatia bacterium]|nr:hypothetical protein [Candidatus Binatia bacterium]